MYISPRWFALPLLLLGGLGLLTPTMVGAAGPPDGFRIRDDGKFFSKEALEKAEAVISAIKKEFRQDLLIETFAGLPENLKSRYNDKDKKAFFESWARERYNREGVSGLSILLCKQPRYLQVEVGKETEKRAFTNANREQLFKVITDHFKQDEFDQGLLAGVSYVLETFGKTVGKAGPVPVGTKVTRTDKTTEVAQAVHVMGPLGWICIGLAVLMVLWVVVGLFRAMTGGGQQAAGGYPAQYGRGGPPPGNYGPGGPPPGYIPPPGYGQPASGGGGFLKGMLGGMLGGAAGMWAYDQFFRGGSGPSMTPPAYGGGTSPTYGAPDNSAGGGTGGDWGGGGGSADTGGGDWGGGGSADTGGGDWGGGGGDTGGGGDWGGGGGDSGGGDWGGGGDSGGGGGDW
ncbi:MAG: TPM domain-containing protein [Gemmataceae bacterium]